MHQRPTSGEADSQSGAAKTVSNPRNPPKNKGSFWLSSESRDRDLVTWPDHANAARSRDHYQVTVTGEVIAERCHNVSIAAPPRRSASRRHLQARTAAGSSAESRTLAAGLSACSAALALPLPPLLMPATDTSDVTCHDQRPALAAPFSLTAAACRSAPAQHPLQRCRDAVGPTRRRRRRGPWHRAARLVG